MPEAHARLAPSSAEKWMRCPGQPREAALHADDRTNVHAAEGTAYHELAAECLTIGAKAKKYLGQEVSADGFKFTVDEDGAGHLQTYLDHCRSLIAPGDEYGIEERLRYNDDLWGTADFWCYQKKDRALHIVDLKFGRGVVVEAEDNLQLLTYALMAWRQFHNRGVDKLVITIVQPRAAGPAVKVHEIDPLDAFEFETTLLAALEAISDPKAPLVAGAHCKWCPAAATCEALADYSKAAAKRKLLEKDAENLAANLLHIDGMKAWIAAVEEAAYALANRGVAIPGHKLIAKRATKKWRDEDNLRAELEAKGYKVADFQKTTWLTPAQAIKKLEKDDRNMLDGVIDASSSGTKLVQESDPGKPVEVMTFDVIETTP